MLYIKQVFPPDCLFFRQQYEICRVVLMQPLWLGFVYWNTNVCVCAPLHPQSQSSDWLSLEHEREACASLTPNDGLTAQRKSMTGGTSFCDKRQPRLSLQHNNEACTTEKNRNTRVSQGTDWLFHKYFPSLCLFRIQDYLVFISFSIAAGLWELKKTKRLYSYNDKLDTPHSGV